MGALSRTMPRRPSSALPQHHTLWFASSLRSSVKLLRTSPLVSVPGSHSSKENPLWALQKVEVDNGASTGLAAGSVCIFIHVPFSNDLTITKQSVSRLLPLINGRIPCEQSHDLDHGGVYVVMSKDKIMRPLCVGASKMPNRLKYPTAIFR